MAIPCCSDVPRSAMMWVGSRRDARSASPCPAWNKGKIVPVYYACDGSSVTHYPSRKLAINTMPRRYLRASGVLECVRLSRMMLVARIVPSTR